MRFRSASTARGQASSVGSSTARLEQQDRARAAPCQDGCPAKRRTNACIASAYASVRRSARAAPQRSTAASACCSARVRDRRRRRATARGRGAPLTRLLASSGLERRLERLERRLSADRLVEKRPEDAVSFVAKGCVSRAASCLEQRSCPVGLARLEVRARGGEQACVARILVARRRELRGLLVECRARRACSASARGLGGDARARRRLPRPGRVPTSARCLARSSGVSASSASLPVDAASHEVAGVAVHRLSARSGWEKRTRPSARTQDAVLRRLLERVVGTEVARAAPVAPRRPRRRRRAAAAPRADIGASLARSDVGERLGDVDRVAVRVGDRDCAGELDRVERVAAAHGVEANELRSRERRSEQAMDHPVNGADAHRLELEALRGRSQAGSRRARAGRLRRPTEWRRLRTRRRRRRGCGIAYVRTTRDEASSHWTSSTATTTCRADGRRPQHRERTERDRRLVEAGSTRPLGAGTQPSSARLRGGRHTRPRRSATRLRAGSRARRRRRATPPRPAGTRARALPRRALADALLPQRRLADPRLALDLEERRCGGRRASERSPRARARGRRSLPSVPARRFVAGRAERAPHAWANRPSRPRVVRR